MRLYTVALKNIIRRKGKMALVIIGLAVGIAALVAVVTVMLAFERTIDEKLDAYGFNIVIYPASSNLSLSYGGTSVSGVNAYEVRTLKNADAEKIVRMPVSKEIRALAPKLLQPVTVKDTRALLVGVDFARESEVKTWWKIEGAQPKSPQELVLGADAARTLKLAPGDEARINGSPFRVVGVLKETGSQDDGLLFGDLREVQTLFKREGELSLIELSARDATSIDAVVAELEELLPGASVTSVKQAVKYKEDAMGSLAQFGLIITTVVIAISGLIVFTTMTATVNDRKREIGIFRAIGYRKSNVAAIILREGLVLSVIGGAIGYGVGFGIVAALPRVMKVLELTVAVNVGVMLLAIGLAVAVGLVASALPARRAANMDPADALKSL